jgi:23S rRNA (uracil1939-C5)-methyltransferase
VLDFLLLDPPRVGCENAVITGILAMRPRRIAYVSCDPATLARDLKKLIAENYSLDSVAAFDMFPQTHHVETVARLTAKRQL